MWPFKRTPPAVDLTNEAYSRWLRAQRPQPLSFFLSLNDLEQEQLATLGDDYLHEISEGIAAPESNEADAVAQLAAVAARRLTGSADRPVPRTVDVPPLSMGGVTERREKKIQDVQEDKDSGRRLMGREPDPIAGLMVGVDAP